MSMDCELNPKDEVINKKSDVCGCGGAKKLKIFYQSGYCTNETKCSIEEWREKYPESCVDSCWCVDCGCMYHPASVERYRCE